MTFDSTQGAGSKKMTLEDLPPEVRERAAKDHLFLFRNFPQFVDRALPEPHVVKILILTDKNGNYGVGLYGLSLLVKALRDNPGPYAQFYITERHRTEYVGTSGPLDMITDVYLREFQELWLFGIGAGLSSSLGPEEQAAIARFMDSGKGVFATGDHGTLGAPLCGSLPRVRRMRRWFDGVPERNGAFRHDSLRLPKEGDLYQDKTQADATPQSIYPTMYAPPDPDGCKVYPHQLLGRGNYVVRYLPDHMHEGQCVLPEKLNETIQYTDPEYVCVEFPPLPDGGRLAPEIVAKAMLTEPHVTYEEVGRPGGECPSTFFPLTRVDSFNLVGAYDGHRVLVENKDSQTVNIGRVVVDSSFHHFMEYNLAEFERAESSADPNMTAAREAYQHIKTYYRNIALWLAPKPDQVQMRDRAIWIARWYDASLSEEILSITEPLDYDHLEQEPYKLYFSLGAKAKAFIANISSLPLALRWSLELVGQIPDEHFPGKAHFLKVTDPWAHSPDAAPAEGYDVEGMAEAVLGGAVLAIVARFGDAVIEFNEQNVELLNLAAVRGAEAGIDAFLRSIRARYLKLGSQLNNLRTLFIGIDKLRNGVE
ncbi:MAG TPA: hypothetical protein VNH22_19655 [Blastocatellia bacterium]|jgi:hypothetical protein|nr:hypothetical protein [Blastocatellia bacterium]